MQVANRGGLEALALDAAAHAVFAGYGQRIAAHEAAHFLVAYLLGLLPKRYTLSSLDAFQRSALLASITVPCHGTSGPQSIWHPPSVLKQTHQTAKLLHAAQKLQRSLLAGRGQEQSKAIGPAARLRSIMPAWMRQASLCILDAMS